MAKRIEITSKIEDSRIKQKIRTLESLGLDGKIKKLIIVDVYTIDKNLSQSQLLKASLALINPNVQIASFKKLLFENNYDISIEIGFLPGVTDNVGNTAKEMIKDLLKTNFNDEENIYTSQLLLISGKLTEKDIKNISESLFNPLIQRCIVNNRSVSVPKVEITKTPSVKSVDLNISDEELIKLGKEGIQNEDNTRRGPLAMDLKSILAVKKYFNKKKRNPTDIELESIAQTWSEHCKHTIFANPIDKLKEGLFKTYIKKATEEIIKEKHKKNFCVSVFTDNSGAIEFDENFLITHKVETHNSPSALDPFGGSITGIVGVNRDAIGFGLGAKPILNTYGFCLGDPKIKKQLFKDKELKQKMLSPKRIMEGVIEGVNVGGNCSGIPTPLGFLYFDNSYQGKPLVFVGTAGLIPKTANGIKLYEKKAQKEDYIVIVGGKVGIDGIHGATFSSEALSFGSPATAVQIGDPITQKKLSDAIVKEARDMNLYRSITDNGAGGLSCSVAEMAKESNGCEVNLNQVPLKYPGLAPWQIWISESQERMTLAVPPNKWIKFNKLMKSRGVEATIIGKFTNSGKCIVNYRGKVVMNLDLDFLHDGLPKKHQETKKPQIIVSKPKISENKDLGGLLLKMLARLNVCSYEFISMQYDHEVQASSVLKPLQGKGRVNGEASVIKPILKSKKGLITSFGLYPSYSRLNTYSMAACSVDTAIRNIIASGGNPGKIALLDNFCWCSPTNPESLYKLKEAAKACYDYSIKYKTPFISGKDSMYNDFNGYDDKGLETKISIFPTLLISSLGVVDDVEKTLSIDLKTPGNSIILLGETYDDLGGSEYFSLQKELGGNVPAVNIKRNLILYQNFYKCVEKELIASAISVNKGGLAVALAKMSMAGMNGAGIILNDLKIRPDYFLFSESQGRIIIEIENRNLGDFNKIVKGIKQTYLGTVTEEKFITININNKEVVKVSLREALKNYKKTFRGY